MTERDHPQSRKKRPPRPLDQQRLQELGLAYVARFATTAAKLETYLQRKLRERGWNEDESEQPDTRAIADRFVELGYIDDAAYARSRSGGLLRRGYGPRRVAQALNAAGVDEQIRAEVQPGDHAIRQAALAMARKRRFGPFAFDTPDREKREKQIAAMLRAGHGFDCVRAIMDAASGAAAENWANEFAGGSEEEEFS